MFIEVEISEDSLSSREIWVASVLSQFLEMDTVYEPSFHMSQFHEKIKTGNTSRTRIPSP